MLIILEIVIPTVHLQTEKRECVSEEKALGDLFTFLETAGDNLILVGEILPSTLNILLHRTQVCVDEDTVSVLLGKLKALDRKRVKRLVSGFTWWKRTLRNHSVQEYR